MAQVPYRWYWRRYKTLAGGDPLADLLAHLSQDDRRAIVGALLDVRLRGLRAARHLRGDLYEVRAHVARAHYRVVFSQESRSVMLALLAYDKNTEKTPQRVIQVAEHRLRDWRARGRS